MAIIIGDLVESKAFMHVADQVGINVRHWRVTEVLNDGLTASQVAEQMASELSGLYRQMLSTTTLFVGISAQKIGPGDMEVAGVSAAAPALGVLASDLMPKQTCGILSIKTQKAGRSFRGRLYIPFPTEVSNQEPGEPTDPYVASATALAGYYETPQTFVIGGNSISMKPVLYSRVLNVTNDVTNVIAAPRWGTQRRRSSYGQLNQFPLV